MRRIDRKLVVGAGAVVLLVVGGTGIAIAAGGSPDSESGGENSGGAISGDALRRASDAALAKTGGGTVTGTEVGDEESYYEVEVTLDNGHQVDVQLDDGFAVVGSSADVEHSDEAAD
ncbi:MAG: hypothetical protein ABWY29_05700 [Blastococcus sp.]